MSAEKQKKVLLAGDETITTAGGRGRSTRLWFKRTVVLGSAGAAMVATLGLLGYLPGLRVLSSIRPDYVPMAITTAVCFLFLAAALFLQARRPRQGLGLLPMEALVLIVTLFSMLNVVGSVAGMDLNFEDRLMPEVGTLGKIPVGHMSPATGAAFIMAGLGTFLLLLAFRSSRHARRLGHWAASLGVLTILAGATVLLSYLYGAPLLYGGTTVPMAATTAIAFLFLGAALIAAAGPENFPMRLLIGDSTSARLSRVFLPLTVTVVLLQGILSRIVSVKPVIHHALFLAGLVIAGGTITAFLVIRVAHSIGGSLDEANRKLRQSEERYRSILNASPDCIATTDMEGHIIMVSPATLAMLGCQREEEVLGRLFTDFVNFDDRARASSNVALMAQGTMTGLGEYHGLRADGSTLDLEVNGGFVLGADGQPTQMVFIIRDITERKQSEKLPETLYKISQAVYAADNLNELFEHVHRALANIIPTDNLFIALLADDGKTLTFPYFIDEKDADGSASITVDNPQSLTVEVLTTKRSLLLDEAELIDRYATGRNKVWGTAPKCWLGVPLMIRETVIGVMAVQDYHKRGAYGRKDVVLLESTAGQIAVAIDRKRVAEALRESVDAFKGYFNMGTVGMSVSSLETGWIEVNDYFCRMLGYSREELVRLTWPEMTHPDDLNADLTLFNQVVAGQRDAYELEKRFIRKNGQVIYTLLNVTCQRNPDGTVHHFLVSLVDISERKRAELLEQAVYGIARAADAAESLDDLYRSVHRIIQDLMPAANFLIARFDEKENLVSFPYFVDEKDPMPKSRKSGRGLTDYVLRTGKTLLSDAAMEKELERRGEAKRIGTPSACWLGVPLKVGDKTIGVIALDNYSDPQAYGEREKKILEYVSSQIANAIERKQAESQRKTALEALRESEEKYRTLVEKANEAIIIAQDGVFVFANRRMSDLVGVPAGDLEGRPFVDFVWPEDRELVNANYRKRIAGKHIRDAYDFRFIGAGGKLIWVFLSAAVIQWKGKPATLNLMTDITERKKAEEALQQSSQKWEAIITASPDGIGMISLDGKLQLMSDKLFAMYGYSVKQKDEITGKTAFDFIDPSNHKILIENISKLLSGKKDFNISEYLAVKKDKSKFYVELSSSVLFDSKGDPESILFVERDITERKQVEAEIKRQLAEKEILLKEVHHRIKNNIASIGGLISLRLQSIHNPEAAAVLKEAVGRVDSMRILYDKLLLSEDYKDISVKNYVESLADTVVALFPGQAKVKLEKRITDFNLDSKRLFPLGIIINELLTNIMKYAFANKDSGSIKISLANMENHVVLTVQDNGIGLPNGFDIDQPKGFGLMLVKMLCQQLGGSFSMEKHAGTRCTVEFNI